MSEQEHANADMDDSSTAPPALSVPYNGVAATDIECWKKALADNCSKDTEDIVGNRFRLALSDALAKALPTEVVYTCIVCSLLRIGLMHHFISCRT